MNKTNYLPKHLILFGFFSLALSISILNHFFDLTDKPTISKLVWIFCLSALIILFTYLLNIPTKFFISPPPVSSFHRLLKAVLKEKMTKG